MVNWAVVVVKLPACEPFTLTIRVRILLKPIVIFWKICVEKERNIQKEGGLAHLKTGIRKHNGSIKSTEMAGFEPVSSGVGNDHSAT